MSKMLTKEEIAEIREYRIKDYFSKGGLVQAVAHKDCIFSHIDALTERLEGMADEWRTASGSIGHSGAGTYREGKGVGRRAGLDECADELRALIEEMKG